MTEQRYGRIIVSGDAADLSIAAKAYSGQIPPTQIGDLLDHDFRIEAHTPAEFRGKNLVVPGTKRLAYGHVIKPGLLWVNNGRQVADQIYAYRHEPFHPLISSHMTEAKRRQLLKLVIPTDGTPYANRLNEVLCDTFVELFWGSSILDKFYGDIPNADRQKAFDILMTADNMPPIPAEDPLPLPLPDPVIAALQAQIAARDSVLNTIHELSAPA